MCTIRTSIKQEDILRDIEGFIKVFYIIMVSLLHTVQRCCVHCSIHYFIPQNFSNNVNHLEIQFKNILSVESYLYYG